MVAAFLVTLVTVAMWTLAERRFSAFIQDRLGPNRVGPWGLLQPAADGLKNLLKEESAPGEVAKFYFMLAPMLAIAPAFLLMAVIPWAAPLPTPWGLVDMVIADVPIGILFILAFSSLGVYGLFLAGWSSNNKYAFLGGLRASAQMVSYEVSLGMSLIPIFMLVGNVRITEMVWTQQEGLGIWFAFPLGLAFFLFVISSFAETNRLPFDMPEAEAELVAGYHSEYSSMKFSMFMIGEYAHLLTQSALMATLFFGGWDIPFWQGDNMRVVAPGTTRVGIANLAVGSLAARTMISPLQVLISQLGEFKSSTDNFQIYIRTNPSLHVPAESGSAAKRWEMPPLPFNYYLDGLNNIYRTVIKH